MKLEKSKIINIAYLIAFVFSCLTTHSDRLSFYGGNHFSVILKMIIIFLFISILAYLNKDNEKSINYYSPLIVNSCLVILIFDNFTTKLSGSIQLFRIWWLGAIFVAEAALFLAVTISKCNYYNKFYYKFWKGFTPTFLFSFIICFIRTPYSSQRTVNYIPFNRSLEFLINFIKHPNGTFENPLYFFGNILFFIPIPFIIKSFFPKLKNKFLALIVFLIPILIETYQYIFYCGDVDIDDLILNWTGLIVGCIVQNKIEKKLLLKS